MCDNVPQTLFKRQASLIREFFMKQQFTLFWQQKLNNLKRTVYKPRLL